MTYPLGIPASSLTYACDVDELRQLLLNKHSACGMDGIPAAVTSYILSAPEACKELASVFSTFLKIGKVPSAWDLGLWTAVHKISDCRKFEVENQRPISLVSNLGKVFEALLHKTEGIGLL